MRVLARTTPSTKIPWHKCCCYTPFLLLFVLALFAASSTAGRVISTVHGRQYDFHANTRSRTTGGFGVGLLGGCNHHHHHHHHLRIGKRTMVPPLFVTGWTSTATMARTAGAAITTATTSPILNRSGVRAITTTTTTTTTLTTTLGERNAASMPQQQLVWRSSFLGALTVRGGSSNDNKNDYNDDNDNGEADVSVSACDDVSKVVSSTASDLDDSVEIILGDSSSDDDDNDNTNANHDNDVKDEGDTNENENEMQQLRKQWSSIPAIPSIEWPTSEEEPNFHGDGTFLADIDDDSTTTTTTTTPSTKTTTKALIIMDGFSPFHGQYLAHAARRIYGAAVIHILGDFCARYLYQVEGRTNHLSGRLPDLTTLTAGNNGNNGNNMENEELKRWKSRLPSSLQLRGIYCESDSGLEDAERLGVALGLYPTFHDGWNPARRDKFLMNEAVKDYGEKGHGVVGVGGGGGGGGLEVVRQKRCGCLEEAEEFARGLGLVAEEEEEDGDDGDDDVATTTAATKSTPSAPLVVVKPLRGVASDDVHLCPSLPSLRRAFTKIHSSPIFGSSTSAHHEQVLVQEFAMGVEYALDIVCKDGERKVAALWRYDKRKVNGAPFVYFGTELVSAVGGMDDDDDDDDGDDGVDDGDGEIENGKEVERAVCNYALKALDALGVRWGISHVEVIADEIDGGNIRVRLVEVNCRQHNTDFSPLTNACVGYNALDMVLAAHLGGDEESSYPPDTQRFRLQWDSLPVYPRTRAYGAILHFVSHVEGTISRIRHDVLEEIEGLPSVMDMHVYPQFLEVGNEIQKTIDIRSDTGWAHLMNDDKEEFRRDYQRLVELMKEMFEVVK